LLPILKRYLKKSSYPDLKNTLKVSVEDKISIDFINEVYLNMNSRESILLQKLREFSVRGGIVDVFSFRMIIHTELSFLDEVEHP
jgi:transcription-repair coupling factor (superfamily II helicase)